MGLFARCKIKEPLIEAVGILEDIGHRHRLGRRRVRGDGFRRGISGSKRGLLIRQQRVGVSLERVDTTADSFQRRRCAVHGWDWGITHTVPIGPSS